MLQNIRKYSSLLLLIIIPAFFLAQRNDIVNKHIHIKSDGTFIVHSHPYNHTNNSSSKSHSHSKSEIICLSNIDFHLLKPLIKVYFRQINKCVELEFTSVDSFHILKLAHQNLVSRAPPEN